MTYRSPAKEPLVGLLKLLATTATAAAFVWFMRWDYSDLLQLKVLLGLIAPVAGFWLIKHAIDGIARLYRATLCFHFHGRWSTRQITSSCALREWTWKRCMRSCRNVTMARS